MNTQALLLIFLASGLAGCSQRADEIGRAAEEMRTATEHVATANAVKSEARQQRIIADAIEIEEQQLAAQDATGLPQRYVVRRDGGDWAVYDTLTGRFARHAQRTAAGLSRNSAEEAAYELQREDTEARFRAAIGQTENRRAR